MSRAQALQEAVGSANENSLQKKSKSKKSNISSSDVSIVPATSRRVVEKDEFGVIDDPTQLDTLILSHDEVDYLNDLSRQKGTVVAEKKDETTTLTDSEFHEWILSRAKEGSSDASYALSKWFTPPSFTESSTCFECNQAFGISRFRHHCRHCGKSFCGDHSSETRTILKYGFMSPVRVCDICACIIDKESRMDRQRWKKERLDDYDSNSLIPYFEIAEDRGVDKAFRLLFFIVFS